MPSRKESSVREAGLFSHIVFTEMDERMKRRWNNLESIQISNQSQGSNMAGKINQSKPR